MYLVHAGVAVVARDGVAVLAAAEQSGEELIKMSEKLTVDCISQIRAFVMGSNHTIVDCSRCWPVCSSSMVLRHRYRGS